MRIMIDRRVRESVRHPSSDEICTAVRSRNPHVSLATVHRILEQFCEVGEARKGTRLHDIARYDGNVEPHHHVVCVRCRRVHDVEIPDVDNLLEGAANLGPFSLLRFSVEIEALCRDCQRGKANRSPASTSPQSETRRGSQGESKG